MHDNRPDVSVVIPAFRAKEFITTAINSALNQNDIAVEVLVVDDASPDGTAEYVASKYAEEARVIVFKQPVNCGPSTTRNVGLRKARAPWIAVLDADDAFEPGRLRRLVADAVEHGADVIADNICFVDSQEGTVSGPRLSTLKVPTLITVYDFVARAQPSDAEMDLGLLKPMYRKAFLEGRQLSYPIDIRHGEDFSFYFNLLQSGARFILSPDVGYRWTLRNSGNSQTKEDYIAQRKEALRLAKMVRGDAKLATLLRIRARELLRLNYSRLASAANKSGKLTMVLRIALRYPQFSMPRYAKAACRKLT